jgi:hypothetical protein
MPLETLKKIPLFHVGDLVIFADGRSGTVIGRIEKIVQQGHYHNYYQIQRLWNPLDTTIKNRKKSVRTINEILLQPFSINVVKNMLEVLKFNQQQLQLQLTTRGKRGRRSKTKADNAS